MITIDLRNFSEVQRSLQSLAAEQLPYALMVTINNTAFAVQKASRAHLEAAFNRPTPLIRGATRVQKATKDSLAARVYIDPKRAPILMTHEMGGPRGHQLIERFLMSKGLLPFGWRAVPGVNMPVDNFGNPKKTEVARIMQQLNAGESGIRDRRCFVISPNAHSHLHPGIYRTRSRSRGRSLMLLYLFVSTAQYRAMLKWKETVDSEAERLLPDEAAKAVQRAMDTAR